MDLNNLDLNDLLGKFNDFQSKIGRMKEMLDNITVEGDAGGGMVKAVVTGNHTVRKIIISPEAMEDREMLEDLIAAAVNQGMAKAAERSREEMGKMTENLFPGGMPPGMDPSNLGMGRIGF